MIWTFVFRTSLIFLTLGVFSGSVDANEDSRSKDVEVTSSPYLFGWTWEAQPDSMARIPRLPASQRTHQASVDQPLRVQKHLPRYRHYRNAAQVHWEVQRELERAP